MRKISLMLFMTLVVAFTACKKNKSTVDVPFKYTHIDSLIMNANEGNADAQVELARCYNSGKGVKQDKAEARGWYKKASKQGNQEAIEFLDSFYKNARIAADKGDKEAQFDLGICYMNGYGYGIEADSIEAVKWIRKSAEQRYAKAQSLLGDCYANGFGIEKDSIEAVNWFRKAAEQGDADAQNYLGICYFNGCGIEKDSIEAVNWFRKAAEQGNAGAQNNLGVCYINGYGIEADSIEAVKWIRKSAEQEDAIAQRYLGLLYENGQGVKQDYVEAAKWCRKAADQGDAVAQNHLGVCYAKGNGVRQDYAEAAKWYRKAAEQDFELAQYNLGCCYIKGNGVKQDYAEAAKWYRKAADQGNKWGQSNLGYLYATGNGVKQDYAEAVKWCRKAAEQEYVSAQNRLGDFFAQGKGVKQDYAEAVKWYRKAAEQGNGNAQVKSGLCYATGKGVEQNFSKASNLIFKGLVKDLGILGVVILAILLFVMFLRDDYKEYKKEGLKKSQSILLSLIKLFLIHLPLTFMVVLIAIFIIYNGFPLLDYGDFLRLVCVPVAIALIGSFITAFLSEMLKRPFRVSSISAESENKTSRDKSVEDLGYALYCFKYYAFGQVSVPALLWLVILVGFSYYWFMTKALGYEPLSGLTSLPGSEPLDGLGLLLIGILIVLVEILIGLIVVPLIIRLVWGWRSTSSRMDWKKMVLYTYCSKPLKKSQYIKGVITPFFVVGLLPLLVSPFINSIGLCLFGIVIILITSFNLTIVWDLRKEPDDYIINDIKGRYAFFLPD